MARTLIPDLADPPETWRAFARDACHDASVRAAMLDSLAWLPDALMVATVPTLLHAARGRTRALHAETLARIAAARELPRPVVYSVIGEALGGGGSTRAAYVRVLRAPSMERDEAIAWSIACAAHATALRGAGANERAALACWLDAGGTDPLAGAEPTALFRSWRDAGEGPEFLDDAWLLASSGAPRAAVEQIRALVTERIERRARGSIAAMLLLRWLGETCGTGNDVPASARLPGWRGTAARALALTALRTLGPLATMPRVASQLGDGALARAVAVEALRETVIAARRGPGEASGAMDSVVEHFVRALEAITLADDTWPVLVNLLLGYDRRGELLGGARWLTDDLRARVLLVAIENAWLASREIAMRDLEQHGVPAPLVPALRALADHDPDVVLRQHARQLARGERL